MPIWPYGCELVAEGNELRILDEAGEIAASVGDEAQLVRGFILEVPLPDSKLKDDQQARELTELCPGPYRDVGGLESPPSPPPEEALDNPLNSPR